MSGAAGRSPGARSIEADWFLVFVGWLIAAVSTLGSLFFSQVMGLLPCSLCWYQRIFLFPLVFILARALFPLDRGVTRYALPLAVAGWLVAAYHSLLYVGLIPEDLQPCTHGVSCTGSDMQIFGVLPIPLLSLLSFSTLLGVLVALKRRPPQ